MDTDKSFLEKISDAAKDIAAKATDAASQAPRMEKPPVKGDEPAFAYMPLATDGLVSDPMLIVPTAPAPVWKRKRPASKRTASTAKAGKKRAAKTSKTAAKKTAKKSARKAAKKSTGAKTKKTAKKAKNAKKAGARKSAGKKATKSSRKR
jgi:hypothetical protein